MGRLEETAQQGNLSSVELDEPLATLDERGRSVPWAARTLHRLYNGAAQRILDEENISIAHWIYLRVLEERGAMSQADLSKRAGIASQTAVPALDRLEERGLVKRVRDPQDRRKYYVNLTEPGQALLRKLMPGIQQMLAASVKGVSAEELAIFWRVTQAMTSNLTSMLNEPNVMD